jgi:hypothetical protein
LALAHAEQWWQLPERRLHPRQEAFGDCYDGVVALWGAPNGINSNARDNA